MSLIQVKFDNTLKQSDIIIPLTNSSKEEAGEIYKDNQQEIQQTLIYGIQSPLIMINNIVVDFVDVVDFELKCTGVTPSVQLTVKDRYQLTSMFDAPGIDNELRIQILPKFEDKYKKINLTFFITSSKIGGDLITLKGEYKNSKFLSSNIKAFGEINTYKLFETAAIESQLGFASNITENEGDKRWVYCDNKSYKELLSNEIARSGVDLQICDYWVDWWNNIVLADIYERYNAIDKDEDMLLWTAGENYEINEGKEILPQQIVASFNNHPSMNSNELSVKSYKLINKAGAQLYQGTDRVYSVYESNNGEYMDYLIQDGDTHKDIFTKHEYLGEVYGEYNYLLSGKKRETFLQKIATNETLEITLNTPILGVMRGNRINFLWYYNDSKVSDMVENFDQENLSEESPESNIPLPSKEEEKTKSMDGEFILDRSISGQYLVTGCTLKYGDMNWEYDLIISRSTIDKPKLFKEDE